MPGSPEARIITTCGVTGSTERLGGPGDRFRATRSGRCDGRFAVAARPQALGREDAMAQDPVARLVKGFLGVGLKHQALARTPAAGIHAGVVANREFTLVVV